MPDENQVEIEVSSPQPLYQPIQQRKQWKEENKQRIMDYLTFKGRGADDLLFAVIVNISAPMFITSIVFKYLAEQGVNAVYTPLGIAFLIAITVFIIASWWIVEVVPEAKIIIAGRVFLLTLGILLGVNL